MAFTSMGIVSMSVCADSQSRFKWSSSLKTRPS